MASKDSKATKAPKVPKEHKVKRAPNAYALFAQEQGPSVKQQHPDWTFAECSRHIAIKWKGLNETQKNVYKQKSSAMAASMPKVSKVKCTDAKDAKDTKDSKAPKAKRPMNAYMHFQQDYRKQLKQQNPNLTFAEIGAESSRKWKELTEDKRQKYVDMAKSK
jgi:hypothetical protein